MPKLSCEHENGKQTQIYGASNGMQRKHMVEATRMNEWMNEPIELFVNWNFCMLKLYVLQIDELAFYGNGSFG